MLKRILKELKTHAPFTAFGALTGIVLMAAIAIAKVQSDKLEPVFHSFHAIHVFLSAIVTSAMYRRYGKGVLPGILIGFIGSVGIASLSDVVFPHHGGALILKLTGGAHHMHFHLPAIEQWWLINPVALVGAGIGMWKPMTKTPHAGHVLLSTWASLFYMIVHGEGFTLATMPLVFVVLFVAVWLPCCVSDIVFPLLFVGKGAELEAHHHAHD